MILSCSEDSPSCWGPRVGTRLSGPSGRWPVGRWTVRVFFFMPLGLSETLKCSLKSPTPGTPENFPGALPVLSSLQTLPCLLAGKPLRRDAVARGGTCPPPGAVLSLAPPGCAQVVQQQKWTYHLFPSLLCPSKQGDTWPTAREGGRLCGLGHWTSVAGDAAFPAPVRARWSEQPGSGVCRGRSAVGSARHKTAGPEGVSRPLCSQEVRLPERARQLPVGTPRSAFPAGIWPEAELASVPGWALPGLESRVVSELSLFSACGLVRPRGVRPRSGSAAGRARSDGRLRGLQWGSS